MTTYRSRKDGSHYPLSKRRTTRSYQTGVAHLGVPRRFGQRTIVLKSSGQFSDEVYYKGHFIGSVRKLGENEYLTVGLGEDSPTGYNVGFYKTFKTQQKSLESLVRNYNESRFGKDISFANKYDADLYVAQLREKWVGTSNEYRLKNIRIRKYKGGEALDKYYHDPTAHYIPVKERYMVGELM